MGIVGYCNNWGWEEIGWSCIGQVLKWSLWRAVSEIQPEATVRAYIEAGIWDQRDRASTSKSGAVGQVGRLAGWQERAWQGIAKGDCREQLLELSLTLMNWLGIGHKRIGQTQRARATKNMLSLFSLSGKVSYFQVLSGRKLWHVQRFFWRLKMDVYGCSLYYLSHCTN